MIKIITPVNNNILNFDIWPNGGIEDASDSKSDAVNGVSVQIRFRLPSKLVSYIRMSEKITSMLKMRSVVQVHP